MAASLIDLAGLAALTLAADLPASSGLQRWVLEQPEPPALALLTAGVIGFVALSRRDQRRRGALILGLGVALAAGLWLTGFLIQTDRERLTSATARLVRSVRARDRAAVDALLAPEVVVASAGQIVTGDLGRAELLDAVEGFEVFQIDEWYQKPDGAALDGPNSARTRAVIRVRSSYFDTTLIPMTWEFTWRRPPTTGADPGWRVARIELLTMWGREPPFRWPLMALRASDWAASSRKARDNAPESGAEDRDQP